MLQWIAILRNLLYLTSLAHQSEHIPYDRVKLFGLIRYYAPEKQKALSAIRSSPVSDDKELEEQLLDLLLSISENERIQIAHHIGNDLKAYFPQECEELTTLENYNSDMPVIRYQKNLIKLNKYISLVDIAILKGKYYLAYKVTYRCLREYYRDFQYKHRIQLNSDPKDISHSSISVYHYILKYLNKYGHQAPSRYLLYFSMVSHNLSEDEEKDNPNDEKSKEKKYDRLYAEYAKDNVQKIIRYISKYF